MNLEKNGFRSYDILAFTQIFGQLLYAILKMDIGINLLIALLKKSEILFPKTIINEKYTILREYHNMIYFFF